MSKNILITGFAGFIGSHTTERFLNNNHNVIGVDNFNDYYDVDFKEDNISNFSKHKKIKIYRIDITNYNKLIKVFEENEIDEIVHLAARAGVRPSIENPQLYYNSNVLGTINLLELAKNFNIKNFIFASSSSVYGEREDGPFSEDDYTDKPTSPYAATKQACERLIYNYHHLYKINTSILRFFTVYGERGRPDMAPYIFTKAILNGNIIKKFGNGTSKRDYTYVGDIVDGIIKSSEKQLKYEILNIGSGKPISLNDFISLLEDVSGQKTKVTEVSKKDGDVSITYADNTKAKEILHWTPKTNLTDGLECFIKWFKSDRQ